MERRDCLKRFAEMEVCAGALSLMWLDGGQMKGAADPADELATVKGQKESIQNWSADLLATMAKVLDR